MLRHYICPGDCEGVSEKPGVCQAENCEKHGEALEECSCQNGAHHKEENKQ